MPDATISKLIINSPYAEPAEHWAYDANNQTFERREGRRPAGYMVASGDDDGGRFIELPVVNRIRPLVRAWQKSGYPGASGTTKLLLEHWYDQQARNHPFFFCQLEAIETLIWLCEGPAAERVGLGIKGDGGVFNRLCAKMATGTGKTVVMAMLIAWQVLNKVAYPQDKRFSKNILIMAPGLTVKSRLAVLMPAGPENYYELYGVVPSSRLEDMRNARVKIINWHMMQWETDKQLEKVRSVDKRKSQRRSDEAWLRDVLDEDAKANRWIVINDEAHHAWRATPADTEGLDREQKEQAEEAKKWVLGLDRLHGAREIVQCYDFSATPYIPGGRQKADELFGWVVSDFGLNDAIETGLVKTPRVVVRTDAGIDAHTYKPKLANIYKHISQDLNRAALANADLPDLLKNAFDLLGYDWADTLERWEREGSQVPPVMISVVNRTETAARIESHFRLGKSIIPQLHDASKTLRIDSKVLDEAESRTVEAEPIAVVDAGEDDETAAPKENREQQAARLRKMVDTVGQEGKPGGQLRHIISVAMLSEGWDAKTVTHIMGVRAFSSQLLCEQVVGRGLRRRAYEVGEDGLFQPEYVNIFGVPFTFLPHEGGGTGPLPPTKPKVKIEPIKSRESLAITWPKVVRVNYSYRSVLTLPDNAPPCEIEAGHTILSAEMASVVGNRPNFSMLSPIELEKLGQKIRTQEQTFRAARDIFDQVQPQWQGTKENLIAQLIGIVEQFIRQGKVDITPSLFAQDPVKRRLMIALNMNKLVRHILGCIREENQESIEPVFDSYKPVLSTTTMPPWFTGKPCEPFDKCHLNLCVYDSTFEKEDAFVLNRHEKVQAWVKNERLGFEIYYYMGGMTRKYLPDYIVRLTDGRHLIIETKGMTTEEVRAKKSAADEWCRAVTAHGGFGDWSYHLINQRHLLKSVLDNL